MLSGAKHLRSSAQGKLREESLSLIPIQCEMLRGVYPERGMKGILRCAQNDKRRACPSEANGAQHDISARFSSACQIDEELKNFRCRGAATFHRQAARWRA